MLGVNIRGPETPYPTLRNCVYVLLFILEHRPDFEIMLNELSMKIKFTINNIFYGVFIARAAWNIKCDVNNRKIEENEKFKNILFRGYHFKILKVRGKLLFDYTLL